MSSSLEGKTGMITPKQSQQKQRVDIEFLLSERETAQNISRRLKRVNGDGSDRLQHSDEAGEANQ